MKIGSLGLYQTPDHFHNVPFEYTVQRNVKNKKEWAGLMVEKGLNMEGKTLEPILIGTLSYN